MKVLIVDDSILIRNIMKEILSHAGFTVVGEASNGGMVLDSIRKLGPDLVVMDINMPVMNGIDTTILVMKEQPTPIVIFSNEVDAKLSFMAIQAGAVDVLGKPDFDQFNDKAYVDKLSATLFAAAKAPIKKNRSSGTNEIMQGRSWQFNRKQYEAIVIGASTGGPVAVRDLLVKLPKNFPVGIAIVQHIEDRFDSGYAQWLNSECSLSVRLAKSSDDFTPGVVLIAPSGSHLICRGKHLVSSDSPPVCNQRPSVDRLFESAAEYYRDRVIAILLTGMGSDGAEGCIKVKAAGGLTIVQDEASSFIYGMPKAAFERGGAVEVLGLHQIPDTLMKAVAFHG